MPKYGLIACFSPVTFTDIGERKFDRYGSANIGSWKMENKIGVLAIQKVAKTGNIGKQVAQRAMIAHLSPMCQGQISFIKTYKWAMETGGPKSNSSEL